MDIKTNWDLIRKHFNKSFKSNFYVTISSIGIDNIPTATPIGSLFLNDDLTGFYFEKFPSKLPEHYEVNKSICVLGVISSRLFWLKSLMIGRFKKYPAIKLYGELGIKRKATGSEINRLKRRMRYTRGLKGNTYLWSRMETVRELKFNRCEIINLGVMTKSL